MLWVTSLYRERERERARGERERERERIIYTLKGLNIHPSNKKIYMRIVNKTKKGLKYNPGRYLNSSTILK